MSAARYVLAAAAATLGAAAVVYGEGDDSPGLQLLGALLVLGAIASAARHARRGRQEGAATRHRPGAG